MVFNVLASINVFPQNDYNTFNNFKDFSSTASLSGYSISGTGSNLVGGQTSMLSQTGTNFIAALGTGAGMASKFGYSTNFSYNGSANISTVDMSAVSQSTCISGDGEYFYAICSVTTGSNFIRYTKTGSLFYTSNVGNPTNGLRGIGCNYGGTNPGKYVCIVASNFVIYSSNWGGNFTTINGGGWGSSPGPLGCDVSDDGNTIYVCGSDTGTTYRVSSGTNALISDSPNANLTWTVLGTLPTSTIRTIDICVSQSGQYMTCGRSGATYITYSKNYGSTWTNINVTTSATGRTYGSMSRDGKYMIATNTATTDPSNIIYSTDYGTSWNYLSLSNFITGNTPTTINQAWTTCSVSGDGKAVVIGAGNTGTTNKLFYSVATNA